MIQDGATIVVDLSRHIQHAHDSDSEYLEADTDHDCSTASECQDSDDNAICEDRASQASECSSRSSRSFGTDISVDKSLRRDVHSPSATEERQLWIQSIQNNQVEQHGTSHEAWRVLPLTKFAFYRTNSYRRSEDRQMESLHVIASEVRSKKFCYYVEGTLADEAAGTVDTIRCAQVVDFSIDQLDCLAPSGSPLSTSCLGNVLVQTEESSEFSGWYRLGQSASTYSNMYTAFIWTADLLKHTMNFVEDCTERNVSVGLEAFEHDFLACLRSWHASDPGFQMWHRHCNFTTDFRTHLCSASIAQFITDQVHNSYDAQDCEDKKVLNQPIWKDMGSKASREYCETGGSSQTVVTEHIGTSFLRTFPEWKRHGLLKVLHLNTDLRHRHNLRRRTLGLPEKYGLDSFSTFVHSEGKLTPRTRYCLTKARSSQNTRTRSSGDLRHKIVILPSSRVEAAVQHRYAVVVRTFSTSILVRWLTEAQDTICSGLSAVPNVDGRQTFYPIGNELFLADSCSCETIDRSQIVDFYTASIFGEGGSETADFVVYSRYCHRQRNIISASPRDLEQCPKHATSIISSAEPSETSSITMRNVSLFSGAGILDEQLRKGSNDTIRTTLTVEMDSAAILSLKANRDRHGDCVQHHSIINILLDDILQGNMPVPDADILTAGCPCQGFSKMNAHRKGRSSQQNCSMLAHTLSWAEVLLPKIVLIENVRGMDSFQPSAAGQAVCCLVALGYQAKITTVKASDLGGATMRDRLFVVASVPGIPLPETPDTTSLNLTQARKQTPSDVTADLNEITNDTLLNIEQPNHVPHVRLDRISHSVVKKLRRDPNDANQGLYSIRRQLRGREKRWYDNLSREQRMPRSSALRRTNRSSPYRTITCSMNVLDARGVPPIHWSEDRVLSIAELRRFYGLPDSFLLISDKSEQLSQLGNSVAGVTGRAWGASIAAAWQRSPFSRMQHAANDRNDPSTVSTRVSDNSSDPSSAQQTYTALPTLSPTLGTFIKSDLNERALNLSRISADSSPRSTPRLVPNVKEEDTVASPPVCYRAPSLKLNTLVSTSSTTPKPLSATTHTERRKRARHLVSDSESDADMNKDESVQADHQQIGGIVKITTCHESLDVTPSGSMHVEKRSKTIIRSPSSVAHKDTRATDCASFHSARHPPRLTRPELANNKHTAVPGHVTTFKDDRNVGNGVGYMRSGSTREDTIVIDNDEDD